MPQKWRSRRVVLAAATASLVAATVYFWPQSPLIAVEEQQALTQTVGRLDRPILVDDPTLAVFLTTAEDEATEAQRAATYDSLQRELAPLAARLGYVLAIRSPASIHILSDLGATSYALPPRPGIRFLAIAPGRSPSTSEGSMSAAELAQWLTSYSQGDRPRIIPQDDIGA